MEKKLDQNCSNIIDYDNVDEKKSKIRLQKIDGTYFLVYEFRKYDFVNNNLPNYVVLGRFFSKSYENWKNDYVSLSENITSLIRTYLLPFDVIRTRKLHDMNLKKIVFNNRSNEDIINNLEFTQEGFDLITNKFLFTDGKIERTLIFDNSYNHYDDLIKEENSKYFKPLSYYYYNYFFNDNELNNISLEQVIRYVDFNKLRLENVVIANSSSLQQTYFSLNNWKEENNFLVTFIDSQIELRKNGIGQINEKNFKIK